MIFRDRLQILVFTISVLAFSSFLSGAAPGVFGVFRNTALSYLFLPYDFLRDGLFGIARLDGFESWKKDLILLAFSKLKMLYKLFMVIFVLRLSTEEDNTFANKLFIFAWTLFYGFGPVLLTSVAFYLLSLTVWAMLEMR